MSRYRANVQDERLRGTHAQVVDLVPAGSRVLDVGCNEGYLGGFLTSRGCRVWGVDSSAEAIAKVSGYEEAHVTDLQIVRELPWADRFFDVILAADVLEHLPDPPATLGMLRRYLAPSGTLIVSLPNVAHVTVRLDLLRGRFRYADTGILDATHLRFFTFDTAVELVHRAGFRVRRLLSGSDRFGRMLNRSRLAALARGLLAYNIIVVADRADD